jgi:hypothetical protein
VSSCRAPLCVLQPSQSSSLWRIKLPPCQAASGYGQSPEEPLWILQAS